MIPEKYIVAFEDLERKRAVSILVKNEKMDKREAEREYNEWRRDYMLHPYPRKKVEKIPLDASDLNKEMVIDMYLKDKMSLKQIGKLTGNCDRTVGKYLKKWGVKIRTCYDHRVKN